MAELYSLYKVNTLSVLLFRVALIFHNTEVSLNFTTYRNNGTLAVELNFVPDDLERLSHQRGWFSIHPWSI